MQFDNVELEFEDEALGKIADKAIAMEIGARGLRSVMEGVMTDLMYSVPSDPTIAKITITAASDALSRKVERNVCPSSARQPLLQRAPASHRPPALGTAVRHHQRTLPQPRAV